MMADSLHLQAYMQAEIDGLRAQLVTLTRERDEAAARGAVMRGSWIVKLFDDPCEAHVWLKPPAVKAA